MGEGQGSDRSLAAFAGGIVGGKAGLMLLIVCPLPDGRGSVGVVSGSVAGCGKSLSQGMAPRHRGTQVIDLPLWGGAVRCQKKSSWDFFRSLVSMRTGVKGSAARKPA